MEPMTTSEEEAQWAGILEMMTEEEWLECHNPPKPHESEPCEPFPYDLPF